jgi:hypothetical protein
MVSEIMGAVCQAGPPSDRPTDQPFDHPFDPPGSATCSVGSPAIMV